MTHAAHSQTVEDLGWNPEDPHNQHGDHHHGHIVVGWKLQLGVLAALLFFTALTIAFFNAEQWAESAFNIHLPNWVNIVGAMSIASIKATLVCMFFMQLRYDKALNTFALLFCLFAVGLFLFFTVLDLSSRGMVNEFKYGELKEGIGGTGVGLDRPPRSETFAVRLSPRVSTGGESIVTERRRQYMAKWLAARPDATEIDWWAYYYDHQPDPEQHPMDTENYFVQLGLDVDPTDVSTANRTIGRTGRTDALELNPAPNHGPGHSDH